MFKARESIEAELQGIHTFLSTEQFCLALNRLRISPRIESMQNDNFGHPVALTMGRVRPVAAAQAFSFHF